MADFKDRLGNPQPANVTRKGDVIVAPNFWRWLAESKVFEAGYGLEDVQEESQSSLVATTATYSLQAPVGDSPIIVPILLKLMMSNDGAALTNYQVLFTKPAALCATPLVISGGQTLTSKHCLYRTNPPRTQQKATALYGDPITVSALGASEYISYHFGHVINEVLTSGLVALGEGPSNVQTFRFLKEGVPHLLTQGAAMLVYIYTGGTDSVVAAYMQWAELNEDDLY